MRTEIGKIKYVRVGYGGYQDAQLGVGWELGSNGWSVLDFWGAWGTDRTETCKWTHEERVQELGDAIWRLRGILRAANVGTVDRLVGKPIEATFDGQVLKSWRVLTEAI